MTALQFPVTYQEVGSDIKRCHTLFSSEAFEVQRLGPKTTPHRPCSANPSTDDSSLGSRAQCFNRFPSYIPTCLLTSSHRIGFPASISILHTFHLRFMCFFVYLLVTICVTLSLHHNIMGFVRFPTFIFCACVCFTYSCPVRSSRIPVPTLE